MIEWLSPVMSGVFSLIGGAIGAATLAHFFQRRRYRYEQLLQRYAEFVSVAADDLDRAKQCEAMLGLSQHKEEGGKELWASLESRRHATRANLLRAAFQIRLLEPDKELSKRVQEVADLQPFIIAADWGAGNFRERFDSYQKEIRNFQEMLEAIMQQLLKKHKHL